MRALNKLWAAPLLCLACAAPIWAAEFTVFSVKGERIDIAPPAQWKLAWMEGTPEGEYMVEYIPQGDDIHAWKHGYLAVQRFPYKPGLREAAKKAGAKLTAAGLAQTVDQASKACPGMHQPFVSRVDKSNGLEIAVGGGYCKAANNFSAYGEGAFVAFVEGQRYLYKIQYGWRPQSKQEQDSSIWGIDDKTARQYLESIKSAVICDDDKANCKTSYQ